MRLGSTHGKGAGSLCGSIRPRFSHVAAACRQKKVQCVSRRLITCVVRDRVAPLIVAVVESRTTSARITAATWVTTLWRVPRPSRTPPARSNAASNDIKIDGHLLAHALDRMTVVPRQAAGEILRAARPLGVRIHRPPHSPASPIYTGRRP